MYGHNALSGPADRHTSVHTGPARQRSVHAWPAAPLSGANGQKGPDTWPPA
jgi:hypothetical protein